MKLHTDNRLVQLFVSFLKWSPVSFGGGYALIPAIEKEVVDKKKWLSAEELADIFGLAGSFPGAIGINSAMLIGYRIGGVAGAIAAMTGMLLPTFLVVIMLSVFYWQLHDNPKIEAAFMSIRATVVALIVYAACKIGKTAIVDKPAALLVGITLALLYFGRNIIHPALLIAAGALAGIVIGKFRKPDSRHRPPANKEEPVYDYMI